MVGPAVELVLLLLVVDAKSLRTVPDFGLWGFGALELWGFEVGGWERELGEGVGRLGLGEGGGRIFPNFILTQSTAPGAAMRNM